MSDAAAVAREATPDSWVGRSVLRVEDGPLLRGQGRFLDDLAPVPGACHAAIVRSQLPHARVAVDASAALAHPGVIGVLTGQDVARLSRPFPAGIDTGVPQHAAAVDLARYVGEPVAVVVARDRYVAEDAAELVDVEYDPLEPVLDPVVAAAACVHDRSFAYGDVDAALARADLVVRERFRFPRCSCTPVEGCAVVASWDPGSEQLTAWSNFQGPFTLHGVAAAALGLRGHPAAARHAARLRRVVRDQGVGVRLRRPARARRAGARGSGALDRGPRRAPHRQRRLDRPGDGARGGLHGRR